MQFVSSIYGLLMLCPLIRAYGRTFAQGTWREWFCRPKPPTLKITDRDQAPPRRGRFDAPSFVAGVVANILVAAFTLALLSAIDGVIA
ncbi:MAG: hypothetical protein WBY67_11590 [Pseudolabrys sp.]|jgi:hypothetical protein